LVTLLVDGDRESAPASKIARRIRRKLESVPPLVTSNGQTKNYDCHASKQNAVRYTPVDFSISGAKAETWSLSVP
jgi:hypothetical protein